MKVEDRVELVLDAAMGFSTMADYINTGLQVVTAEAAAYLQAAAKICRTVIAYPETRDGWDLTEDSPILKPVYNFEVVSVAIEIANKAIWGISGRDATGKTNYDFVQRHINQLNVL